MKNHGFFPMVSKLGVRIYSHNNTFIFSGPFKVDKVDRLGKEDWSNTGDQEKYHL